jgi:hypothetical protein
MLISVPSRSAFANRWFASDAQNEQETQPASPIGLAAPSGPKGLGQLTV